MSDYLEKGKEILSRFTRETGFTHKLVGINIVSSQPKRLADFYRDVLGADICDDEGHGGPNRIEIWFGERNENTVWITVNYAKKIQPPASAGCGCFGFEFRVADANKEYERIRNMGVEIKYPPQDVPWGYRYFGIKDPDGNSIDIVQAL